MTDILIVCDKNKKRPWARDRLPGVIKALKDINILWKIIDIYSILGQYDLNPSKLNERFDPIFKVSKLLKKSVNQSLIRGF